MKNNVTPRFWFLLLLLAQAGIGYAAQGINFNYVKSFNAFKSDKSIQMAQQMVQDDAGYLYTYFTVEDTTDIDPGSGVQLVYPQTGAYYSACLVKLTAQGELVWAKNIIVDTYIQPSQILIDGNSLYLFGTYRTSADFDPGVGTAYLNSSGSQNTPFVAKYTLNGDYVFAKNVASSTSGVTLIAATVTPDHRIVIGGSMGATTDFDPTAGTLNLTPVSPGYYDAYVAAYDTDFTTVVAYRLSSPAGSGAGDFINAITVDYNGNIYVAGSSGSDPLDSDFFGNNGNLTSGNANGNGFVIKYNSQFQWQWACNFVSTAYTSVENMKVFGGVVYLTLRCDGGIIDFDPSANLATTDFSALAGTALVALNDNGTYEYHKAWRNTGLPGDYIGFSNIEVSYGRVLLTGNYIGAIDLDPDVPVSLSAATTELNPFLMLLNNSGNLVVHTELAGNASHNLYAAFDKQNVQQFYLGGTYSDSITFGAGALRQTLVANKTVPTTNNSFLAKYDLLDIAPDTASRAITFSDVTDSTITVSFTRGNGEKRLVICRALAPVDTIPSDGVYHGADAVFGFGYNFGGQYAVYNDTGSSFTVTGLDTNTTYYFEVFEFNGVSSQINYLTESTLTGSQKTTGGTVINGIADAAENICRVFPNPAKNYISLQTAGLAQSNGAIQIIDVTGNTIIQQTTNDNTVLPIDISMLSNGVYFVQVKSGLQTQTSRFIKE